MAGQTKTELLSGKLLEIQSEVKAPKGQWNDFGKYNYRSCEDILEELKPLLAARNLRLTLSDELVLIGERYYIKAEVLLYDIGTQESFHTTAFAREEESKKGMDGSQITGTSSSYARKYALNGLFLIDDSRDSDTTNNQGKDGDGHIQQPARKSQTAAKPPAAPSAVVVPEGELAIQAVPEFYKAKDGKKPHSVKLAGDWYTTFSDTDGETLREASESGWTVTVNYVMKGDYRNITGIPEPPDESVTPTAEAEPLPEFPG